MKRSSAFLIKTACIIFFLSFAAFKFATSVQGHSETVQAATPDQIEFFEKKIRPLLAANCAGCHNAKAMTAGLDLMTVEGFTHGGENGSLINKEKPEESRLLKVISYDETVKMPPTGKLKADQITDLTAWVKMGAPYPGTAKTITNIPKNASVREFTEAEKNFWAWQALKPVTPPKIKNTKWVKSPIDNFVLAKLEEKGITPAAPADKLTLLRRATFDLNGLPPTEKEMSDFVADKSPDAFKKVIERLLASPRYGERWGRHWLDVARYADSTGNDEDHRYPHAWKYRDYVIEAFNKDLPYSQFIREQLAGDLIPAPDGSEVNKRGIIATGFLSLGAKAIAQQDKKKMIYDVYDEQVDVTSKAFLGMTMACARCHNHKFDPILTKDYYSMIGIFASTKSFSSVETHVSVPLEKPLVTKAEFEAYKSARKAHLEKDKRAKLAIQDIIDEVKDPVVKQYLPRFADFMMAARKVYQDGAKFEEVAKQTNLPEPILKRWVEYLKPSDTVRGYLNEWNDAKPQQVSVVANAYQTRFQKRFNEWQDMFTKWRVEYKQALLENKSLPEKPKLEEGDDRFFDDVYFTNGPFTVSSKEQKNFNAKQWASLQNLQQEVESLKKNMPPEPDMACAVEDGEVVPQKVFIRGDYNSGGDDAPPSFPAILAQYDNKPNFSGSGRLQLANWLTQPNHPLTSRVMMNRVWGWHFGEGIVRTPDNFGKMGEKPSHPELLDWMAQEFVNDGYSIKSMHRKIMLSSTYQMSSENTAAIEADPDNRMLSRFNRRRLSIEEMRDGLLAIDGTIDYTVGGTLQSGRGTDGETSQGRLSLNPETLKRRSVYIPLRRANLPTLLNLFDFGDATTVSGKRQLTNVATQALFWLNSGFLTDRSEEVAKSLLANKNDNKIRLSEAYSRILNRQAKPDEIASALQYLESYKLKFVGEKAEQKAWQSFCRILMASNDFAYLD